MSSVPPSLPDPLPVRPEPPAPTCVVATGPEQVRQFLGTPLGKLVGWVGIFTALALLDGAQTYSAQHFEDFSISWSVALRRGFECYYTLGLLGCGVLWLARRYPLERGRAARRLAFHFAMSVVMALAFSAAYAALLTGQMSAHSKQPFVFGDVFQKLLLFYGHIHLGGYWFIVLAHHGWHYYQRYRERERHAQDLEAQLTRARLEALRMQLNPHFLFNTLNTIAALIHDQPEAADRTVTRLSELLRQSLDESETYELPLRQELTFLERYLEIEQTRFGDRLTVQIFVPTEVREALVPSLVLQPIVENAIRHGIEPREQAGRITVSAARQADQLILTVSDNGPGLVNGDAAPQREGIGLSNTRSRLQALYGEAQALELRCADAGGLEVRVTLPFHTAASLSPAGATVPAGRGAVAAAAAV